MATLMVNFKITRTVILIRPSVSMSPLKISANIAPKLAAAIFNKMNDLTLAARILNQMSSDDRGAILGAMDATVADEVTKLMEPAGLPELSNSSSTGSGK